MMYQFREYSWTLHLGGEIKRRKPSNGLIVTEEEVDKSTSLA